MVVELYILNITFQFSIMVCNIYRIVVYRNPIIGVSDKWLRHPLLNGCAVGIIAVGSVYAL